MPRGAVPARHSSVRGGGYLIVALTALTLLPSESACLPSIVTSGARRLLRMLLFWSSAAVTLQCFGLVSNRLRIVAPVEPAAQPQVGGVWGVGHAMTIGTSCS